MSSGQGGTGAALADAMKEEYETITAAGLDLQLDCPDLALSRHMLFSDLSDAEFLRIAAEIPVKSDVEIHPLEDANSVLQRLKASQIRGAAVLQNPDPKSAG